MIQMDVDGSGVIDYLDATREKILQAVRVGMQEAMVGLAHQVVSHTGGGGTDIVSRSGRFVGAVLGSPKVSETDAYIKGTVSGIVDGKPMGIWFDEGTSVPAVAGTLFHFTAADGASVFTHGHGAFKVAPHPIMNKSLEEYKPILIDIITAKIQGAVNDSV
jgi:hypothetical protein